MTNISQVLKEQFDNIELIIRLALYELKGKYSMHYLGMLWQFVNPLIQILVYWFVFGIGIRGGSPIHGIPFFLWLITGLIPWFFINSSMSQGANSIYSRLTLVSKMKFPMSILPTVSIMRNLFNFIVMLGFLILLLFLNGIKPSIYYIQILYYMLCMFMFLFSFTLLLSTFTTIIRDVHSMLQATLKVLFYLTPILWDTSNLPESLQLLLELNPINYLIKGFRDTLLYEKWFFTDLNYSIYFWVLNIIVLLLGAKLHLKLRRGFVDYL